MMTRPPPHEQTQPDAQLSFADVPTTEADPAIAAVCDLIAGDPLHARDRRAVVETILAVGCASGGFVDPNLVREQLPPWVFPRIIGPTYRAMCLAGALAPDGWVSSTDRRGRNAGRPARAYRLTDTDPDGGNR